MSSGAAAEPPTANRGSDGASRPIQPLGPEIRSIQPGEGFGFRIERAWGELRRAWLRRFRPAYVERMATLRRGVATRGGSTPPHDVLDPRDLKLVRNVCGYSWAPEDDPFGWRERLPFARPGLIELLIFGGGFAALALGLGLVSWPLAVPPGIAALLVLWFFRDPRREPPADPSLAVSPADGKVVEIREIGEDPDLGEPAVLIGIFLSVFDVHVNRLPVSGRVLGIRYRRGAYLNAMRPDSAEQNEALEILVESNKASHRAFKVRQIVGAIARRIVCWIAPGEELERGERYGMIKFGSRTEIVLPVRDTTVLVEVGARVKGGLTPIARLTADSGEGA